MGTFFGKRLRLLALLLFALGCATSVVGVSLFLFSDTFSGSSGAHPPSTPTPAVAATATTTLAAVDLTLLSSLTSTPTAATVHPSTLPASTPASTVAPTATPTPTPTEPSPLPAVPPVLFGVGPEADGAVNTRLAKETRIGVLSSWFNSPDDLAFMRHWKDTLVPRYASQGYCFHVITYSQPDAVTASGQSYASYPISDRFVRDMGELARIFRSPCTYFSLVTEFQTYIEPNNEYNIQTAWYYDLLRANLLAAQREIKSDDPNAQVSFSWGGWQTAWDDPANGGGRSMLGYFAQEMAAMDFMSFQAMGGGGQANGILRILEALNGYNARLMVAHYAAEGSAYADDMRQIMSDAYMLEATSKGLFAFSFIDGSLADNETAFQIAAAGINRYSP